MRKLMLAAALAASLPGCATIPTAPADLADQTKLDEQAALSIELAYQAAALAVSAAADLGVLRGANASKAAEIDRRAYSAVKSVRAAYDAGNSASYANALILARAEVASLLAAVK